MANSSDPNRQRVKRLVDDVRRILLDRWDPLFVGGNPRLADEYDDALGSVMACLAASPTRETIVEMLSEDWYGVEPDLPACEDAADHLLALVRANAPWPNSTADCEPN